MMTPSFYYIYRFEILTCLCLELRTYLRLEQMRTLCFGVLDISPHLPPVTLVLRKVVGAATYQNRYYFCSHLKGSVLSVLSICNSFSRLSPL